MEPVRGHGLTSSASIPKISLSVLQHIKLTNYGHIHLHFLYIILNYMILLLQQCNCQQTPLASDETLVKSPASKVFKDERGNLLMIHNDSSFLCIQQTTMCMYVATVSWQCTIWTGECFNETCGCSIRVYYFIVITVISIVKLTLMSIQLIQ